MTRTLALCRLGLAGAATAVLLTACGGSSGTNTASSSSAARTASTPTATTTAAAAAAAGGGSFCDQARAFLNEVQASTDAQSPQRLQEVLPTLASQLAAITPPPEIAADWQQAVSAIQQLAQSFQGANLSDPQFLQQLEQKVQPLEAQLATGGSHIEAYLGSKCGISASDTGSATS